MRHSTCACTHAQERQYDRHVRSNMTGRGRVPCPRGLLLVQALAALATACSRERGKSSDARATLAVATDASSATVDGARQTPPQASNGTGPPELPAMPDWSPRSLAARQPNTDGPRFYVKTRHVWIYPEPNIELQWIGFLWTGGSVRLKSTRPIYGPGCTYFHAIEPEGYICMDGNRGTLDPNDRVYRQLLKYAPRTDSPWLHRYGEAKPLKRYFAIPGASASKLDDAGVGLAFDLDFSALAPSVHEPHVSLIDRSTVAYTVDGEQAGKEWLLTSDYAVVEKASVTPYPDITFHGVHLSEQRSLPLAFFRGQARPRYAEVAPDRFEPSGTPYPRNTWVGLTGTRKQTRGEDWLETKDGGWVRATDATVPTPAAETPWGGAVGARDAGSPNRSGRGTWIEVSILGGWLIAYEGPVPVFTTLISPGSGGLPKKGHAPIETYSTPLGRFQINGKFISSTMIGPTGLVHSEVPYAQNFADLYAIHTAYWHDNWGHPMSGGCVNVSPLDGYFLFHWTEPDFPSEWYGKRWRPSREPSTTVIIHR